jgi:hypothetical protein
MLARWQELRWQALSAPLRARRPDWIRRIAWDAMTGATGPRRQALLQRGKSTPVPIAVVQAPALSLSGGAIRVDGKRRDSQDERENLGHRLHHGCCGEHGKISCRKGTKLSKRSRTLADDPSVVGTRPAM